MKCVLCNSKEVHAIYKPPTSSLGLTVHACELCGLVQSWPRQERTTGMSPSPSSSAQFGGLRYGKGFRAEAALERLEDYRPLQFPLLDVGAGRGDFVRMIRDAPYPAVIKALEPDDKLIPKWLRHDGGIVLAGWICNRIEDLSPFYDDYLNTVVMIHTLEHLAAPVTQLKRIHGWSRDGCLLYVEVPNLAIITVPDFIEEFFIDRHLTHFTGHSLETTLNASGWRPLRTWRDTENAAILAAKSNVLRPKLDGEFGRAQDLIATYYEAKIDRLEWLGYRADSINVQAKRRKLAAWGLGRVFDALCRNGLDPAGFVQVIDAYLPLDKLHGRLVSRPHDLVGAELDAIVIFSREYADEIAAQARLLLPEIELIRWDGREVKDE